MSVYEHSHCCSFPNATVTISLVPTSNALERDNLLHLFSSISFNALSREKSCFLGLETSHSRRVLAFKKEEKLANQEKHYILTLSRH